MHPYLRVLVAAIVAMIIAGALVALALAGRNTTLSVLSLLAAGVVAVVVGGFLFLQSWIWSQRSWRAGSRWRSLAMALGGGIGIVVAAVAAAGTLVLLLAFGLLAGAEGAYTFAEMRISHPSPALAAVILCLAIAGTGSKAGLVPLHAWLPLAHPAAPSHVSALMSGVMTKIAVYGFIRIVFDLAGEPSWWWSMIVLALAGITCVLGVLYALMQHDLKRLLAYHTVESVSDSRWHSRPLASPGRRRSRSRRRFCTSLITPCSRAFCSLVPAPCSTQPASATWNTSAASFTACRRRPSHS